jgi:hypothetical protein
MDAAVASATAAGTTAGQKAEAARFTAITGSEDGKKKPKAAMAAYSAGLSAEQAALMLAGLPEEKAEAAAPAAPAKVEGKQKSGFDAAMEGTKNPQVGAESGGEGSGDDKMSVVDSLFAAAGFAPAATRTN